MKRKPTELQRKCFTSQEIKRSRDTLPKLDDRLQLLVVNEAIAFLAARTGGYALSNLIKVAIKAIAFEWGCQTFNTPYSMLRCVDLFEEKLKTLSTDTIIKIAITSVLTVDWLTIFRDLKGEKWHDLKAQQKKTH